MKKEYSVYYNAKLDKLLVYKSKSIFHPIELVSKEIYTFLIAPETTWIGYL